MAKVTIILEDIEHAGDPGLSVDIRFDEEPVEGKEMTIAQQWAHEIINQVMSNAQDVEMLSEGTVPKRDIEGLQ